MLCNVVIKNLLQRHKSGFDFTLDRVIKLLKKLNNPHTKLAPIIHIAGTNGKGSTSAFCRAILEASGANVNVHTSPHLVHWRERFRINGKLVEEAVLAKLIQDIANIADDDVTIFEILTICAMLLFKESDADFNIFEVGLGGRLDATNVIEYPICSVITPISLDHCSILGDNIEKIAFEKAGIIKGNCNVVFGKQENKVLQNLIKIAEQKQAPYYIFNKDFDSTIYNKHFIWHSNNEKLCLPKPNLAGKHQIENAATAIKVSKIVKPNISKDIIVNGLRNVSWAGRLQLIKNGNVFDKLQSKNIKIWLDGAHNEAGAFAAAKFFEQQNKELILICGMLNTKDNKSFLKNFASKPIKCYTTPISETTNSVSATSLANTANNFSNIKCTPCKNLIDAIEKVNKLNIVKPTILLIAGSLHLVGEFLALNNTLPN